MKELDFINIVKEQIGNEFIGDDCAYLKDLGIVITQDSLVEDIHFKKEWYTPYELGYKSIAVNISDVIASGAEPKYITVALSLPNDINNDFIKNFYIGAKDALYGAKIVGGDITGSSDKIFISIAAIGTDKGRKISSRASAKVGYSIIVNKNSVNDFGKSSLGLDQLLKGIKKSDVIEIHKKPILDYDFAKMISSKIKSEYAMMDTSDGLADALFKIAESSQVSIVIDDINGCFGAEDYKIVAAVPKEFLKCLANYYVLGEVVEKNDLIIKIGEKEFRSYKDLNLYDHFGGKYER